VERSLAFVPMAFEHERLSVQGATLPIEYEVRDLDSGRGRKGVLSSEPIYVAARAFARSAGLHHSHEEEEDEVRDGYEGAAFDLGGAAPARVLEPAGAKDSGPVPGGAHGDSLIGTRRETQCSSTPPLRSAGVRSMRSSEDATCNRLEAARACRRCPVILEHLASGALTLTAVRLLSRHLTVENHQAVLDQALGRSVREIDVAHLAPRPDTPSSVRKRPSPLASVSSEPVAASISSEPDSALPPAPAPVLSRPVIKPTAPERYRVQFTIGQTTQEKLRRLQTLLRREIPDGDPAVIFDQAITLLLERVESRKRGRTVRPRPRSIRRATDREIRTPLLPSRAIPQAVKDEVSRRDGEQCAFVSSTGRRCNEREFREFHHLRPWAMDGPATPDNIALRCRRHNQHEAELVFGAWRESVPVRMPATLPGIG
jgi:hypothetical protein